MSIRLLPYLLCLIALPVAADWAFDAPREVSGEAPAGAFFHLESAGRRNLAVGPTGVGIVWEDNRDGIPRIYLAHRPPEATAFQAPSRVSGQAEAYEPVIAAVEGGFLIAWEERERVRLRHFSGGRFGPEAVLDPRPSAQVTLVADPAGGAYAAWIRRTGGHGHVVAARIVIRPQGPHVEWRRPVELSPPAADQLYPSLAMSAERLVVGWEDRRHGHTRLYTALYGSSGFSSPRQLNELPPPRSASFGRGSGVTRLVLAGAGDRITAVWMDKRDFQGGYDVYAAVSDDGGRSFGPNELVQDPFGDNQPQWHPAVAVDPEGRSVVVWDDPRDGSPDLWLSWRGDGPWSDDLAIPGGQGPGAQDNPAIAIDAAGDLHIAWVDRDEAGGRILYTTGSAAGSP